MRTTLPLLFWLATTLPAQAQADWVPLAEGSRWTYSADFARQLVTKVTRTEQVEGVACAVLETNLLRSQFPDEKSWQDALRRAATNNWQLRREVQTSLRDRSWLEKQIEARIQPNDCSRGQRGLRDNAAARDRADYQPEDEI